MKATMEPPSNVRSVSNQSTASVSFLVLRSYESPCRRHTFKLCTENTIVASRAAMRTFQER